jgi:hypothetical protein
MQNIAVDVEANFLIKRSKVKAKEKDKIEKEHVTFAEMKLDILTNTMKELIQKIRLKDELGVQRQHVPLVP